MKKRLLGLLFLFFGGVLTSSEVPYGGVLVYVQNWNNFYRYLPGQISYIPYILRKEFSDETLQGSVVQNEDGFFVDGERVSDPIEALSGHENLRFAYHIIQVGQGLKDRDEQGEDEELLDDFQGRAPESIPKPLKKKYKK